MVRMDNLRQSERLFLQGHSQRCHQLLRWLPGRCIQYSGALNQPECNYFDNHIIQDVGERLSAVHKAAGEGELDLARALDTCVHAEKIRELVVNEKSSLRELTIAVLMTHWDFIAPVFFYRYYPGSISV